MPSWTIYNINIQYKWSLLWSSRYKIFKVDMHQMCQDKTASNGRLISHQIKIIWIHERFEEAILQYSQIHVVYTNVILEKINNIGNTRQGTKTKFLGFGFSHRERLIFQKGVRYLFFKQMVYFTERIFWYTLNRYSYWNYISLTGLSNCFCRLLKKQFLRFVDLRWIKVLWEILTIRNYP